MSVKELCGHFGMAIGMYFWTLQLFSLVFFALFLAQVGASFYY